MAPRTVFPLAAKVRRSLPCPAAVKSTACPDKEVGALVEPPVPPVPPVHPARYPRFRPCRLCRPCRPVPPVAVGSRWRLLNVPLPVWPPVVV